MNMSPSLIELATPLLNSTSLFRLYTYHSEKPEEQSILIQTKINFLNKFCKTQIQLSPMCG